MILLTSLIEAKEYLDDSVVAIGNFDGVHKGHQALIECCVKTAEDKGLVPVVFTFINHPANEIAGKSVIKNIMTLREKAETVEKLGIEVLVAVPFEDKVRTSSPERFAKEILVEDLKAKHAICGYNNTFGYKGEGHPEDLIRFGKKYGFEVTVMDEVDVDGVSVSSTLVRQKISEGDMEAVERLCGRRYSISGKVIQGQHLGRKMGFPTVNLSLNNDMALPLNGVYITDIYVEGIKYHSVTNVGNKPSVGHFAKNAETHIFDFSGDIYGQHIKVEFIKMLRPEILFSTIEELSAQIDKDCMAALEYHKK